MFYSEVRVGGLFNLKGKQALLIMKLQCNQRKSLEHFTTKCLRHINSKTKKNNPAISLQSQRLQTLLLNCSGSSWNRQSQTTLLLHFTVNTQQVINKNSLLGHQRVTRHKPQRNKDRSAACATCRLGGARSYLSEVTPAATSQDLKSIKSLLKASFPERLSSYALPWYSTSRPSLVQQTSLQVLPKHMWKPQRNLPSL